MVTLKDECKSINQCSFEVSFDSTRQSSPSSPSSSGNPSNWAEVIFVDSWEEGEQAANT